jgi:cellulose synthase/poly-beta-1,6-N-acetylglucosamine synthase-like glycosyltransferase
VIDSILEIGIISLYLFSLTWITVFSMGQLYLTWVYSTSKSIIKSESPHPQNWATITIQLPVFNEKYVIDRLLSAVAALEYPRDLLTIQVLDDSTDETTDLIGNFITSLPADSFEFQHVRRINRTGFKAGALAHGMKMINADFIAIFDADFVPKKDFLRKIMLHFENENTGMVQAKWSHLNDEFSLLTRMQAFGLNAHFTVEQGGRYLSDSFINFNGTAGIWRKQCIEDAGGWMDDTLTEDLDLSYRAQLAGWKLKYVESLDCPGELPVMVPAIKSQQYRWNKGAAESARKHLKNVMTSSLSLGTKSRAILHLLNSSVFVFLLIAAILSIPMLHIKHIHPDLSFIFNIGTLFILGFIAIGIFYWVSTQPQSGQRWSYFLRNFPLFMTFSMGMSLHNSIAIIEGWLGKKSPFIRTPKFNVENHHKGWKKNTYVSGVIKIDKLVWIELILALYFGFGVIYGMSIGDWGLIIWHLMLSSGFLYVSVLSIKSARFEASI